ncbi:MAG: pyridoxal phosphate-dependent aminotransferase, partial [Clostridia bacterium]|nr:pyridoxal phosphate-dependent aminotransferase [Clostridia bacterium]
TIKRLVDTVESTALHGYTSAQGDPNVRDAIAQNLNKRFNANYSKDLIYMTCGAAAGLAISLKALCEENDEVVLLAPFFPEYTVFVKSAGGTPVTVPFDGNFQIDFDALKNAITKNTKAIIVNSPNNPCGVIYTRDTLTRLAKILNECSAKFGHPIFIIADEPYRELAYDGIEVPFIPSIYDNTLFCYSFSKSLSLPGERIGYLAVSPKCEQAQDLYYAIMGAGRALGYVCAPTLFQYVVAECIDAKPNIGAYEENRNLLYGALTKIGFECVHPSGAFYLFVKSPSGDGNEFSERAKKHGLLIVPADSFSASGWVRIAYCVSKDMILRSLDSFKNLYDEYQ